MIKILTSTSLPSAKILALELQSLVNERVLVTTHPERIKVNTKMIRYGNSDFPSLAGDIYLNSANFIQLCSNKRTLSNLLNEYGFFTPLFFPHFNRPESFPVIVRDSLSTFGGRGIHVCNNINEFNQHNATWTPFIKTQFELRVHILGGEVKRIFKKEYDLDEPESEYPIRNLSNGYHFSLKELEHYPKVIDLFSKISEVEEIGNENYYAADIGWDSNKKEYFIFEFNSAPGLNDNTAKVYAEFLAEKI
jgi:glutathione synthase/RimK-type ligase-like ATP-grasp enzyme